ncbi:MAG: hypothetical protein AAB343_00675 [Patescibacteria group bacterium]
MSSDYKEIRGEFFFGCICSIIPTFIITMCAIAGLRVEMKSAWTFQTGLGVVLLWVITISTTLFMCRIWLRRETVHTLLILRQTFPSTQKVVDENIMHRMEVLDRLCREQEVLIAECRHTKSGHEVYRRLGRVTERLEEAKEAAWAMHRTARQLGFRTFPKIGDYLAETNLTS